MNSASHDLMQRNHVAAAALTSTTKSSSSSSSLSLLSSSNNTKPPPPPPSGAAPKCLLNLKEILQMFNCSISQEQAWAILYELLNELKFLFEHDFQFVNENKDKLAINSVYIEQEGSILLGLGGEEKDVAKIVDAYQTRLLQKQRADDARQRSSFQSSDDASKQQHDERDEREAASSSVSSTPPSPSPSPSPTPPPSSSTLHSMMGRQVQNDELEKILTDTFFDQQKQLVQKQVLKSVAYLIFDALDYGNNYSNEPVLNNTLSRLLLLISGHYKEYKKDQTLLDNNDEADGIYSDDEDVDEDDLISFDKAILMCKNHVAECDYHYRAVCRGLYAQAFELKVFLSKIEDSKNILQKSGKEPTHYCFEVLDKNDWAKLWMQVIHELRNVHVKLRKVASSELSQPTLRRRHVEYELTPFEILLEQIRARKYSLKKVTLDQSLARELKKDARDIILDFIRSRPPLKKSSLRNLGNKQFNNMKFKPINLHEQLMHSIRNNSTPLRKTSNLENLNKKKYLYKYKKQPTGNDLNEDDSNGCHDDQLIQSKKILKPDKKLLLNNLLLSDDDDSDIDDDELNQLNELDMNENASLEESNSFYLNLSLLNSSTSTTANNCQNLTGGMNGSMRGGSQAATATAANLNGSLVNLSSCSSTNLPPTNSSSNSNKKRIKPAESLKTPLSPWCDGPIENWRSLINGTDVLINNNYNL